MRRRHFDWLPVLVEGLPIFLLVALALVLWCAFPVKAQPCSVTSGPTVFLPITAAPGAPTPTPSIMSNGGFANSLAIVGNELLVAENRGYRRFRLDDPARPTYRDTRDMVGDVGLAGDGTSFVTALAGTRDGERGVVGWEQSPNGGIILRRSGTGLAYGGDWGDESPSAIAIGEYAGTKYLGLLLNTTGLYAADLTTTVGGTTPDSQPYGKVPGSPTLNRAAQIALAAGVGAFGWQGGMTLVDARSPAWGTGAAIAASVSLRTITVAELGFATGTTLRSVSAVSLNGLVYLFVEGNASGASRGVRAFVVDPAISTLSLVALGSYTPTGTFSRTVTGATALILAGEPTWAGFWSDGVGQQRLALLAAPRMAAGNLVSWSATIRGAQEVTSLGSALYVATGAGAYALTVACGSTPTTPTPTVPPPTSTPTPTPTVIATSTPGPTATPSPLPSSTPTALPSVPALFLHRPDGSVIRCDGGCWASTRP